MNEIVNQQRKIKLDWQIFEDFVEKTAGQISQTCDKCFTVAFVSDRKMRALNKTFRGKDATTDVLSFPLEDDDFYTQLPALADKCLGDIVISVEQAARQAEENNLSLELEIKQLILHGILHLCGFDHETDDGEMNRRELKLRENLGI